MNLNLLLPEWKRIDLLASCVAACRQGKSPSDETKAQIRKLQGTIEALRGQQPWTGLATAHGLKTIDQDLLACIVAPEAEPQIGWVFHDLQPGINSVFPTSALLSELLFLDAGAREVMSRRLGDNAPLLRAGFIERSGNGSFVPLRPTMSAQAALLDRADRLRSIPGAIRLNLRASWEDLALVPSALRQLQEFMLWITHREIVTGSWGAKLRGGPLALFAGPSGTGKTFAAEAIGAQLGWDVFRVDLGLLVSKYVGETEKNLNILFDRAHGKPLILVFDEADSLFGKRGEVRDARDRYANMEVSHLLSRIERHDGPCILTSNLRHHLDAAFLRRFQAVVEFPIPAAAQREQLWRSHLPPRAPTDVVVTPELLAESVILTGGQIRNASLHAAFLAAEAGTPITLTHIATGIWRELGKDGREMFASSLGSLEAHLPREFQA